MAASFSVVPVSQTVDTNAEDLKKNLRSQARCEINGETLKNPERFMLDQKYGLVDPVLTREEKQLIEQEVVLGRN